MVHLNLALPLSSCERDGRAGPAHLVSSPMLSSTRNEERSHADAEEKEYHSTCNARALPTSLAIPSITVHEQHFPSPSSYAMSRARFSPLLFNPFSPPSVFSHFKSATLTFQWGLPADHLFPVSQRPALPIKFTTTAPGGIFPVDEYPQWASLAARPQSRSPTSLLHLHCCSSSDPCVRLCLRA